MASDGTSPYRPNRSGATIKRQRGRDEQADWPDVPDLTRFPPGGGAGSEMRLMWHWCWRCGEEKRRRSRQGRAGPWKGS